MTLSVDPLVVPVAGKYVPHLVAHEFFHTWAAGLEMPGELRWVYEGFTDYYAYLIPARLGLTTWPEFAAALAEKMQSCATNPQAGRRALTAAGGDIFFREKDAYELVYGGGPLLAAWLDRAIRQREAGKTLDDLMRAFYNDPRWGAGRPAPTLDDFLAAARGFVAAGTADKLRQFVERPFAFDPVVEFAALGVAIRRELGPPVLDLRANLDGQRVVDLDRNALAYRIGVRPGDRFLEVNGRPARSAAEVRDAWRQPTDKRIRLRLARNEQTVMIDEPIADTYTFTVLPEPWQGS
jgi:predicted metalloprotease with PDZ domain